MRLLQRAVTVALAMTLLLSALGNAFADALPPDRSTYGPPAPQSFANEPGIEVRLSSPIYRIHIDPKTGAPTMPRDVVATARPVHWPAGAPPPESFGWKVYLDWASPACVTRHRIDDKWFAGAPPFKVDLSGQIRGGDLTVLAKTTLNGVEICGQAHAMVLGENPTRAQTLAMFPRSRFGLIASKIGVAESGLRQFTAANGADPGGMPVLSHTNDVGMMQLNGPSGSISSADEVWDWRANVRRGLEILGSKRETSFLASRHAIGLRRVADDRDFQIACLNFVRGFCMLDPVAPPPVRPISDRQGTGSAPSDLDVDNLKLSEWERDSIRRYNGGQEYAFAVEPDPLTLDIARADWKIDPSRGGVNPHSGDPAYVQHVLIARSGFDINPPPKPKPKPLATTVVHHRRKRRGKR